MSLAYRDDAFDDWEEIAHAIEIRKLKCTFGSPKVRCFVDTGGGGGVGGIVLLLSFVVLPRSSELFNHNFKTRQVSLGSNSLKT